ncbi:MAG: amidohydrolase family protein [Bryobacteraceae bacterium]
MNGIIDAHVHVWTSDTRAYPRTPGAAPWNPIHFPPETLFTHTKANHVDRVVLIQPGGYRFDNSYMLDAIRSHPGVFSGVAIIDSTATAPEDEMRRLRPLGIRGFRITPGRDPGGWLDTPGMRKMWASAHGLGQAMCPLINPNALASVDRAATRNPETRVVIDHLARVGASGGFAPEEVKALCGLARHPNVYVKLSAFYALGAKQPPYTDLIPLLHPVFDAFGPRRLMWASDAPYQAQPPHSYAASIALMEEKLPFLTADDRLWILRKTAESVFFI